MASLSDFPIEQVQGFIQKIADKRMTDGSVPGQIEIHLTVDEARLIWAAAARLDFYCDWGAGIEQTRFKLRECQQYLEQKKTVARNELVLMLDWQGMKIMKDAALHLDRLGMMMELDGKPSRKYGGKKR